MTPNSACGTCGTPLTAGFCPRCLLGAGVAPDGEELPTQSEAPASHPRLGDYELLEEIGRGGMGIVYRARQVSLDRTVAVKLLPFGRLADKQAALRLRAEAVAAGSLRHPNIVVVHEVGLHDEQQFIAMDYVPGPSLARLLRDGPLPGRQAAQLLRQVALAVQHAHERGIIHRDLKPSNILVDSMDNQPRITDFGLAKNLRSDTQLTLTGQTLGSPNYIPPEQIRGSERKEASSTSEGGNPTEAEVAGQTARSGPKVSFASDVYALGATLYHALTGRPPFIGHDIAAVLHQVLQDEPLPPRRLNPSVAADLETICLKCLEKEPGHRYATAKEMADELDRFLNDEPIHARPLTRLERAWRWCRRKPALASLGGSVLVLMVLLAVGAPIAAFRINRERQRAEAQAYTADMNVVLQVWKDGNLKRAQELLRAHLPRRGERDLRGFEWRYLWKLCQDESLRTIPCGTNDRVGMLASSAAHSFLAACSEKAVRLLDPCTGDQVQSLAYPNPEAEPASHLIALAPHATNLLAAHHADGVVGLWDVASKVLLSTLRPLPHQIDALALSPDGRRLAVGDGHVITMWDISRPIAPSQLWSLESEPLFGPELLKFSPDGQTIVANVKPFLTGTIGAWDVETGRELAPFPKRSVGFVMDVAFSPDGRLLAASGVQSSINIWDFTNRTVSYHFEGHLGHVTSLAFSPEGDRLVSAGTDGTIRVWDIQSRATAGMFRDPLDREVLSVAFAPDGKSIFSTTGEELKIWSSEPRPSAGSIETHQLWGCPALSPDGKWLVTLGGQFSAKNYSESESVKVWDVASGRQKFYLLHPDKQPLPPVFSPDGKFFALGGEGPDRVVSVWETALWDSATAPPKATFSFTNEFEVGSISFSPDGKIMAMAGMAFNPDIPSRATNRLAFREVGSWRRLSILEGAGAGATEKAGAATVAFSNDGRLLAIGYRDGWVRLWDFKRQQLVQALKEHGDDHFGVGVSFSADGRWLATVGVGGSPKVVLFDLSDLGHVRPALETKAHAGNTWSAIFAPDSRTLVTSGGDGLIKFWNLQTLNIALTLRHNSGLGVIVGFAPDGKLLASQDANGLVKLWRAAPPEEIGRAELAKSPRGQPGRRKDL